MTPDTIVVLAKSPQPGLVKTRLQPIFSPAEAAALASAAIRDTLDAALATGARRTVVAWDGPPVSWLPSAVSVVPQRGSSLDQRLEHVFQDVLGDAVDAPTVLVGMDTPQLTAGDLCADWYGRDAVLGPSQDGGYWAIGFRRYMPGVVVGVPMSTDRTSAVQLARLRAAGLDVQMLQVMRDVDEPDDAAQVAAAVPQTLFARLHRRLLEAPCSPVTPLEAALAGTPVQMRVAERHGGPAQEVSTLFDPAAWQRLNEADQVLLSR